MGTLAEVGEAVQTVTSANNNQLVLLHGVSKYPALIEESNLTVMEVMAKAFGFPVGYSDHTIGIDTTLAAVALGARVIEKHFTLNARLPGPDHAISLEPGTFKSMVNGIRRVELALGSGIKAPTEGEISMRAISRKSIVSARAILAGTRITAEMLTTKRPGTGIQPRDWDAVIGRRVKANMLDDSMLQWKDIE
jgi:sialic acid synthase SpsE